MTTTWTGSEVWCVDCERLRHKEGDMLGLAEPEHIYESRSMFRDRRIQIEKVPVVGHRDQKAKVESRSYRPDSLLRFFWHSENLHIAGQALRYNLGFQVCLGSTYWMSCLPMIQQSVKVSDCSCEALTSIELVEPPLPCNHGAVLLLFLFLPNGEVNHGATVRSFLEFQILSITVALIYAIDKDVHRNSWRNESVRGEVYGK